MRALLVALVGSASLLVLLPAGTPGGVPARVVCTVYRPDAGTYARLSGSGALLPDGGVVLPDWPDVVVVRESLCSATTGDGGPTASVTPECACSNGSDCAVTASGMDGGAVTKLAPIGVTLRPGTFSGGGCIPKVCGVIAGLRETWPASCPGTR